MKKFFTVIGVLLLIGIWVIALNYVAGIMLFLLQKNYHHLSQITPITWLQYYVYYTDPVSVKFLKKAMGISVVLTTLLPLFFVAMIFGKKGRKLHGEARFARISEIRTAGFLGKADNRSILLGKVGNQYLCFKGSEFAFLAAPTRRGKGVGCVIPNLLHYTDSVVVLDIKGENFKVTAGFRQKYGQEVYLFNPFAEDGKTHRYNPLGYIRNDENLRITDIQEIAQILYPHGKSQDSFFDEQARNLFLALALYLCETPELPRTLGELYRQSSGNGTTPLLDHYKKLIETRVKEGRPLSQPCVQAFSRFLSLGDKTLSSVKGSFDAPLLPFASPLVDAATSCNDFDFKDLRRKPMSVYIAISPRKLAESPLLINLLFSQLIGQNLDELPENNPDLKYECLLLMDEFPAIGKITIISKAVSFIAGYGLRLFPIFQSNAQIVSIYGQEDARNLLSNHAVQIVYTPNDQRDAEDYSKMLGFNTEHGTSKSKGKSGRSETVSDQRRALLLPQEIRELPLDKEIICSPNCKPILAKKIRYYDDADFKKRLLPPPDIPKIDFDAFKLSIKEVYAPPIHPRLRDDTFLDQFIKNYDQNKNTSAEKSIIESTRKLAKLVSPENIKRVQELKNAQIEMPPPLDEETRRAIERALEGTNNVESEEKSDNESFFTKEQIKKMFEPKDYYQSQKKGGLAKLN